MSYPMARYWLHCSHLYVNCKKMSKSKGNILYIDDLQKQGYTAQEIRFFLIYGTYREQMNYSDTLMNRTVKKLRSFNRIARKIEKKADRKKASRGRTSRIMKMTFVENMNNDLNIKKAFDGLCGIILNLGVNKLNPHAASGIISTLREIDEVFQVGF